MRHNTQLVAGWQTERKASEYPAIDTTAANGSRASSPAPAIPTDLASVGAGGVILKRTNAGRWDDSLRSRQVVRDLIAGGEDFCTRDVIVSAQCELPAARRAIKRYAHQIEVVRAPNRGQRGIYRAKGASERAA